ncbi:response regulator transcription factor [Patescibacteria group bacterium]|nr:response regulator transcription factor [Patescibacteria group bacterium]
MAKKILLADDDLAILDATKMLLELEGYEVQTTAEGVTVKEMIEQLPDLLLLDIWMSGQDGKKICKKLKANKSTKHIPIVMISASRDVEDSARAAGADAFMTKPFEMNDLLARVKEYAL